MTNSWAFPPNTREVQFDEKWSFVGKKEKHCDPADPGDAKSSPASDSQGKAATPKSGPLRFTISRIPRNAKSYPDVDLEDLSRSFVERERDGFRDVGPAGHINAAARYGPWPELPALLNSLISA